MNVSGQIGGDDSLSENGQAVSYTNFSVAENDDDGDSDSDTIWNMLNMEIMVVV